MSRHLHIERMPSGVHFPPNINNEGSARNDYSRFTTRLNQTHQYAQASPRPPEPRMPLCLPLLKISTEVTIDGTVASTKLIQRFINRSEVEIHQAHYTFPLYDGAVVTAFKCSVGDEMVLVGKVEPRDYAKNTYDRAVTQGYAAALLEEHTPEIFKTMVGNIPSMTEVEVEIKYVSEVKATLLDGRKEGLELVIPMSIAPRYGKPVGGNRNLDSFAPAEPERSGLDILVKINNDGSIQGVEQSHNSKTKWNVAMEDKIVDSFGTPAADKGKVVDTFKPTQIHVRHTSAKTIMDEDFVVTIETSPEHPLRSRAVLSPTNNAGHAALLVNVKPAELFEDAARAEEFDGEIIFMLDQSASMGWPTGTQTRTKIQTLQAAMPRSLISLPSGCAFNVLSFGGTNKLLWDEGSQPCTESNREAAIKYGGSVQPDMGGTELLAALKAAVASRLVDRSSTQIIIITDGEVEENKVLEFVWKTRQDLGHRIRFFALGIGIRVPHRLIGRIGEFGGGYGEVVDIDRHPQWSDRLTQMLQAGIMPSSWEFDIDLGRGFERKDLMEYQLGEQEGPSVQSDVVSYVQAPYPTPAMHPFSYRSVFFLLELGERPPPSQVTLRSTTPGTKTQTTHVLPVAPTWTDKAAILHLTIKAVLVGLEAQARGADWERAKKERVQSNAERLGTLYSITSQWTSFVAVDPGRKLVSEVEFHKTHFIKAAICDVLRAPTPSDAANNPPILGDLSLSRTNDAILGDIDPDMSATMGGPLLLGFAGRGVDVVAFSPDSHYLASASYDYTVKIWDPATGHCLQTLEGHRGSVGAVAFSPDSHYLASASYDDTVKIWDPATGHCLQTLEDHRGSACAVAFSPDSHYLASASNENTVKIWDPATGHCLQTLEGHRGSVGAVAFSPDSHYLASASYDDTVKIWDPATGHCLQTLEGHRGSVGAVAFSPDSHYLASASYDDTVKIWDPATGHCLQTLEGHRGSVGAVAFSPDSHYLASASYDDTVKVWDPATGHYLQTLEGHSYGVKAIAFSPDSHYLASASNDYTVKIWDPATGRCLQTVTLDKTALPYQPFSFDFARKFQ
ncbi:Vegetative incompatibility protein HET-E-1 [Fusarium oxysporum f. sp. conglutinans]|nr:Vegetative incompatibility protein HET-E-1 [Fusarium oxysporum f. sp. conglutinans]